MAPLAIVLVIAALTPADQRYPVSSDLRVYLGYVARMLGGAVPYRGFPLEYPPFALLPMAAPQLLWPFGPLGDDGYLWLFTVVEGCVAIGVGLLLRRMAGPSSAVVAWWVVLAGISTLSVAWRYDLWPAAFVLGAVAAAHSGRPGLAGLALGIGTMLKLFPIVVVPILAIRAIALGDRAGLVRLVLGAGLVIGVTVGGAWILAGPDSLHWVTYQLDRGLQLESVGSGVFLLLHVLFGQAVQLANSFSSLQLASPGSDVVVSLTPILQVASVGLVCGLALLRFRRAVADLGRVPLEDLVTAAVAVLIALLVTSKVFSIQYIVWFLPLAPLLPARERWLVLAIAAFSTLVYPIGYAALWELQPWMTIVLNVRNALLVACLVWLCWSLARGSTVEVGEVAAAAA